MGDRAAVVIGVNTTGRLTPLQSAAAGAKKLATFLEGEGFEVRLITDEAGAVRADDIEDAIDAFVRPPTRYRMLLVYFSGHGYWQTRSDLWLLSRAPQRLNEAINLDGTIDAARNSGIPNVVFISDACRSLAVDLGGAMLNGALAFPFYDEITSTSKVDVFRATSAARPAYEAKIGDEVQSLLTRALISIYEDPPDAVVKSVMIGGEQVRIVPNRALETLIQDRVDDMLADINIELVQKIEADVPSADDVYIARARQKPVPAACEDPPGFPQNAPPEPPPPELSPPPADGAAPAGDDGPDIHPFGREDELADGFEPHTDDFHIPEPFHAPEPMAAPELDTDGWGAPVPDAIAASPAPPEVIVGDQGDPVMDVQRRLKTLNYDVGVLDGVFGPVTERAVKTFQQINSLPTTGVVDAVTRDVLATGRRWKTPDIGRIAADRVRGMLSGTASALDSLVPEPVAETLAAAVTARLPTAPVERFESQTGFVVYGAAVADGHLAGRQAGDRVELLDAGDGADRFAVVRAWIGGRGASTLITLADGRCFVLPALHGYIGHCTVTRQGLASVAYVPSDNNYRWDGYVQRRGEIDQMRAEVAIASDKGTFSIRDKGDADAFADKARTDKAFDPVLGLYAAYAYVRSGNDDAIRSVFAHMQNDLGAALFDVAMLAARPGTLDPGMALPFCPLLTQGWNLLASRRVALKPVVDLGRAGLADSLWTTFQPGHADRLRDAMSKGEVR